MSTPLLNVDAAAQALGISRAALLALLDRRELFGVKDGAEWKFKPEEIERYKQLCARGAGAGTEPAEAAPQSASTAPSHDSDLRLDGGSDLEPATDSDLSLSEGADLERPTGSGDSGLSLELPGDSGLSLEDDYFEEDGYFEDEPGTGNLSSDADFLLTPTLEFDDQDDDSTGSQVIALETDESFDDESFDDESFDDESFDDEAATLLNDASAMPLEYENQATGARRPAKFGRRRTSPIVKALLFLLLVAFSAAGYAAYWFWENVYQRDQKRWDAVVSDLREQLSESRQEREADRARLAALKSRTDQLEGQLAQSMDELGRDVAALRRGVASMPAAARSEREQADGELKDLIVQVDAARSDNDKALESKIADTEQKLQVLQLSQDRRLTEMERALSSKVEPIDEILKSQRESLVAETKRLDALYQDRLSQLVYAQPAGDDSEQSGERPVLQPAVRAADVIRQAVRSRNTLEYVTDFGDLEDLAALLEDRFRIPVSVDHVALRDEAIDGSSLSLDMQPNASLGSALTLALAPHDLDWLIRDGALLITTRGEAESRQTTRVYDVADLVGPKGQPFEDDRDLRYEYDALSELLRSAVDSDGWFDDGVRGSIQAFDGTLTIKHNRRVHEQVEELLAELRGIQERRSGPGGDGSEPLLVATYRVLPPWQPLSPMFSFSELYGVGQANPQPQVNAAPATDDPQAEREGYESFAQALAAVIPKLVEPESWADGGGVEAIPGAVVVKQTAVVHAQVRRMLRPFAPPGSERPLANPNRPSVPGAAPFGGGFGIGPGMYRIPSSSR